MRSNLSPNTRLTPRLELRPFRRRDLDLLYEAVLPSLPDLNQWLPWAHLGYAKRDAMIFLRDSVAAWAEGRAFDLSIRYRHEPDRHLGNVSVWHTSRQSRIGEVGYWVRSDEWGRGVATEATARVLGIAFDELELHKVTMRIAVGNRASERVAEKLGFTREGLLRQELQVRGVWLDHSVWGLLEREYRTARSRYRAAGWVLAGEG